MLVYRQSTLYVNESCSFGKCLLDVKWNIKYKASLDMQIQFHFVMANNGL